MRAKKIFLLLLGIFTLLFLSGCSFDKFGEYLDEEVSKKYDSMEKRQQKLFTVDKFKSVSEKFGYRIEDIKSFDKSSIKTLIFAEKLGGKIEFYVTKDNKKATNLFNLHKKKLEKQLKELKNPSVYTGENAITGDNSDYFAVLIKNDYIVIYRLFNNFLYLKADSSMQDESRKMLKKFGCYDIIYLSLDSAYKSFVRCLFDKPSPSKSTKTENVFVENPKQFTEIASIHGFKTL